MRVPWGLRLAAVIGLVVLSCTSCSDDDPADLPTGPGVVAGHASVPPSLEGSWVIESSIATSTCGFLREYFTTDPLELRMTQVGNDLAFDLRDACGRAMPSGDGTVTPTGIVTLSSRAFRPLTTTCTLRLSQVRTGTAGTPPNVITGADVLSISGSAGCAAGVPCTVNGTFIATRCPAAGCGLTCN